MNTPRTDAKIDDSPYYQSRFVMVEAAFAKELELELNEAKSAIKSAYWQLLPFLKPGDEKTKAVLEELQRFM